MCRHEANKRLGLDFKREVNLAFSIMFSVLVPNDSGVARRGRMMMIRRVFPCGCSTVQQHKLFLCALIVYTVTHP